MPERILVLRPPKQTDRALLWRRRLSGGHTRRPLYDLFRIDQIVWMPKLMFVVARLICHLSESLVVAAFLQF